MGVSFKKISVGGLKGWMREDLFKLLPSAFFEDPLSFIQGTGGKVIVESKLRWAALFALSNGRRLFLKRDMTKGWFEYLKYAIFPSKGRKEWFIAYQAEKRHLPVPKPLGWLEHIQRGLVDESYYVSEAVGSGIPLIEETDRLREAQMLGELVKIVRRMHDSGLDHRDLHAGNFLRDGESLYLTDLHRARILKSVSVDQRLGNLSHLFHSLRSIWGGREQARFLEGYLAEDSVSPQTRERYLRKIHEEMSRLQKKQWQSRSNRCLKESSEFSVRKEPGARIYHRKDFPLDRLKRAVEQHLLFVKRESSELVKNSPEVAVSLFRDEGQPVCVKQFRFPRLWDRVKDRFRLSKGMKAWMGGNGLRVRGMNSIKPLALVEKKSLTRPSESLLVMEAVEGGQELDRYLLKGFETLDEKRQFIKAFALWLSHFHQNNLYHGDMKTCNILVSGDRKAWGFNLLDFEDISVDQNVSEKMLFRNFLQLNTSTPRRITRTDRLSFFKVHQAQHPVIKNQKKFILQLAQKSRERGIVYVSPEGVVVEKIP